MTPRILPTTRPVSGFPSVSLRTQRHAAPVDVTLIAQLPPGGGSRLVRQAALRQRSHSGFVDALDEPSVKLAGVDPLAREHSSLYSFMVGERGHPFHRHAGPRVFTAVSGSAGAQLRFSAVPLSEAVADANAFLVSLHVIHVPPDSLFTVRFSGLVWHQFVPADPASGQPALFALSCHPDETAGLDSEELRARVQADQATIPMLTEVLPADVQQHVDQSLAAEAEINRFWLSLAAPPLGWRSRLCRRVRTWFAGRSVPEAASNASHDGFSSWSSPELEVRQFPRPPLDSLLWRELESSRIDHQDLFRCRVSHESLSGLSAWQLLDRLLRAFVDSPPVGVSSLMMLRNALVRPLGLRRSRLGCPVSSLLSEKSAKGLFAGYHPVLAQRSLADGRLSEVVLGADDRHLRFRTVVGVEIDDDGSVMFFMGTAVECLNAFGRFYMKLISGTHQRYVAPTMMRAALAGVLLGLGHQSMPALVPG